MKRKDWTCKLCGAMMIKTSDRYRTCRNGCGGLVPLWGIKDLPLAVRIDYKRFEIAKLDGVWEYVPHAHKGCQSRAPEPRHIVAKIRTAKWAVSHPMHRAMTFRPSTPPKPKKKK
jgi:hypothetical protein